MPARLLDLHRRSGSVDGSPAASIGQTLVRLARLAEAAHRFQQAHGQAVMARAAKVTGDVDADADSSGDSSGMAVDSDGLDRCVSLAEHDDLLGRSPAECVVMARRSYSTGSDRANGLGPRVVVADGARTEAGWRVGAVRTEVNR